MKLINKIKCALGIHNWKSPLSASLDSYWLQVGKECAHCQKYVATKSEISGALNYAYQRGKERQCILPKTLWEIKAGE
jgi:hypothetical protein